MKLNICIFLVTENWIWNIYVIFWYHEKYKKQSYRYVYILPE
jgi:hypothetical protein